MAGVELQQANYSPGDEFPRSMLCRPYNHALQNAGNAGVLPTAFRVIDQRNDHWEDVPQPVGDVAGQDRPRNPPHINATYHGMPDHYPRPLGYAAVTRVFPGPGLAQEVPAQAPPNVPENQDYAILGYAPQPDALDSGLAAFHDQSAYQPPPAPDQPAAENLRQLAIRYLRYPNSQVKLVCIEPGAAGSCKVVITVEIANIL